MGEVPLLWWVWSLVWDRCVVVGGREGDGDCDPCSLSLCHQRTLSGQCVGVYESVRCTAREVAVRKHPIINQRFLKTNLKQNTKMNVIAMDTHTTHTPPHHHSPHSHTPLTPPTPPPFLFLLTVDGNLNSSE